MWKRLLLLLMLILPAQAGAQELAGSWALRVEGTTIFRYDLERDEDGRWTGRWVRPGSFASDGNSFARMSGTPETVRSSAWREIGGWTELSFPDPRPGAVPDVFRFRLIGPDRAEMIYVDTGLAPYVLVRVPAGAPIGPWEEGRVYRRRSVEALGLPPESVPSPAARPSPGPQATPAPPVSEEPAMIGR